MITVGAGANGLQTMLPVQGPSGTLSRDLERRLAGRRTRCETVKGIQYAIFAVASGTYVATYS